MGGDPTPPFFSALSILARLNGLLAAKLAALARQRQNLSQARVTRVTRLNDQLVFTRTCIKIPCNLFFINLRLTPVSFDDEKR